MLNKSIGTLINNRNNRYKLVLDIAAKAREISADAENRGEILIEKPVTLAMNELASEFEDKD